MQLLHRFRKKNCHGSKMKGYTIMIQIVRDACHPRWFSRHLSLSTLTVFVANLVHCVNGLRAPRLFMARPSLFVHIILRQQHAAMPAMYTAIFEFPIKVHCTSCTSQGKKKGLKNLWEICVVFGFTIFFSELVFSFMNFLNPMLAFFSSCSGLLLMQS